MQEPDGEIDDRLDGHAGVVGDAVFGVGGLEAGEVEPIVFLAVDPEPRQPAGQPGAPTHLQGLAGQHDEHADPGHDDDEPPEGDERLERRGAVFLLQGVEEPALPAVHRDIDADIQEHEGAEANGQAPGERPRSAGPEAPRQAREGARDAAVISGSFAVVGMVAGRRNGCGHELPAGLFLFLPAGEAPPAGAPVSTAASGRPRAKP